MSRLFNAAFVLGISFLLLAGCTRPPQAYQPVIPEPNPKDIEGLNSFKSWGEISSFISSAQFGGYYGGRGVMLETLAMPASAPSPIKAGAAGDSASDYSQTNVQVQGVDEADMVKSDGKYIYAVSQPSYGYYGWGQTGQPSSRISIINAYPAEQMELVSTIEAEGAVQEIFVYKNKLVAFGSSFEDQYLPLAKPAGCDSCRMPQPYYTSFAFMKVYDISDRASPELEKAIEVKGSYFSSRMIGGKVYAIFQDYADSGYPVPVYSVDGVERTVAPNEIKYFDWPDENYNFNTFIGLNLDDLSSQETRKVLLMGTTQNLFVSKDNIYVTYTRYNNFVPLYKAYSETYGLFLDDEAKERIKAVDGTDIEGWRKDRLKVAEVQKFLQRTIYNESGYDQDGFIKGVAASVLQQQLDSKIQQVYAEHDTSAERTVVNKIALNNFAYTAKGEVKGHVLNQFSMDEHNNYFRIATTSGELWGRWWNWGVPSDSRSYATNNVYVLDSELEVVGTLEGLAPNEKIYSARFMGDRLYLVTFKKVDPFFVIDLSKPSAPKVLGKLKIPGYSDYLHPYDENHVIGLGKGAVAAEEGDFAWYQGVKLSLFDVSDLENPKEVAKYEIGDRGTDSYALSDHHAFLFSKEKNLLVIPITLAEVKPTVGKRDLWAYGDFTFQGAYVFSLTPKDGFTLRGRVTHADESEAKKMGDYYWSDTNVKRSLYMDDYLYTISDRLVLANSLSDLSQIGSVMVGERSQTVQQIIPENAGVPTPVG